MANILTTYLKELHIKHTSVYTNNLFNNHPYKHNLYGLSKMLSIYNIPNIACRVLDKDIDSTSVPFVAHINNDFVVVKKINDTNVSFIWNGTSIIVTKKQFTNLWTGVALFAEPTEYSVEPQYRKHYLVHILYNIKMVLLCCIPFFYIFKKSDIYRFNEIDIVLLFFNFIGVLTCLMLLQKQIFSHVSYVDKICSLFSMKDCNNILESKGSKLLGWISLSEIGFGYFLSNLLIILLESHAILYITIINSIALPFTLWSIWYQYRMKQWCLLCLIVLSVLWLSVFTGYKTINIQIYSLNYVELCQLLFVYIFCILTTNVLSNLIKSKQSLINEIMELNSIKYNESVFRELLKKQPYYKTDISNSNIIFGNMEASIRLTVFTNPHCMPCARMHAKIKDILNKYQDKLSIQYIFTSFNNELMDSSRFLIATYQNYSMKDTIDIYNKWFDKEMNNAKSYIAKTSINIHEKNVEYELLHHIEWKTKNKLLETPTILVNGYKLPSQYKIEDVIQILN